MYVLVFIVPHVDIELEDNKQFISNIPRKLKYGYSEANCMHGLYNIINVCGCAHHDPVCGFLLFCILITTEPFA